MRAEATQSGLNNGENLKESTASKQDIEKLFDTLHTLA